MSTIHKNEVLFSKVLDRITFFVKGLRGNVGAVFPRDRPAVDEECFEVFFVAERLKHGPIKPTLAIRDFNAAIVESNLYLIVDKVLCVYNNRKIAHIVS